MISGIFCFCFYRLSKSVRASDITRSRLITAFSAAVLLYISILYISNPILFNSMFSFGETAVDLGLQTARIQESGLFGYAFSINKLMASMLIFAITSAFYLRDF